MDILGILIEITNESVLWQTFWIGERVNWRNDASYNQRPSIVNPRSVPSVASVPPYLPEGRLMFGRMCDNRNYQVHNFHQILCTTLCAVPSPPHVRTRTIVH